MYLLYLLVGLPFLSNSVGSFSIKSKCVCVYSSFKCLTKSSTSSSPGLQCIQHQILLELRKNQLTSTLNELATNSYQAV